MLLGDPFVAPPLQMTLVPTDATPTTAFVVPPFTLIDQSDQPFASQRLEGQIWVATFFFTSCPSLCPQVMASAMALSKSLDEAGETVEFVTFTVDPKTDTPAVLASYAASRGIDTRRWTFLTGQPTALEQVIVDGFKQPMGEAMDGETPTSALEIAHGVRLVLVDHGMEVRGLYDLDEAGRSQLQADIERLRTTAKHLRP